MPTHHFSATPIAETDAGLIAIGALQDPDASDSDDVTLPILDETGQALAAASGIDLAQVAMSMGFDGASGSSVRIPTGSAIPSPVILLVGLGRLDDLTPDSVRRAGAVVAESTRRVATAATTLHHAPGLDATQAAQAIVEGVELAGYRFNAYKNDGETHGLEALTLHEGDATDVPRGMRVGTVAAEAACLVRDLTNTPSHDKRPPAYADRLVELVADLPVEVTVLDDDALLAGGYGGHIGVGKGSDAGPRLVELRYRPASARTHIALVGKGITFDSGGLSLKPPAAMEWMKVDMAGSATMAATIRAAAQLELDVAITAVLCIAENMPSGAATRPGDVLTILGGKTVEVLNTDAEGRLVLADGLVHVGEMDPRPDIIVDAATLTGGLIVALGPKFSGLLSDDDELAEELLAASRDAAEPLWRLPMASDEYGEELKSTVADVRNLGGKGGSTIRAALFLKEFVPDGIRWAHLDIAGPAWNDGSAHDYVPAGATGSPARTLVSWLLSQ